MVSEQAINMAINSSGMRDTAPRALGGVLN